MRKEWGATPLDLGGFVLVALVIPSFVGSTAFPFVWRATRSGFGILLFPFSNSISRIELALLGLVFLRARKALRSASGLSRSTSAFFASSVSRLLFHETLFLFLADVIGVDFRFGVCATPHG
ncbi:MAG: hypothetical protein MZV70_63175 [Desulfobacterales bacterium]|nr:hypothetical protein [Desulfobacterales bacterium]